VYKGILSPIQLPNPLVVCVKTILIRLTALDRFFHILNVVWLSETYNQEGRGFDSWPFGCHVTILRKLFT